jgi:hypothetical protein
MTIHRDHKKVNGAALASLWFLSMQWVNIIISGFNYFESDFTDPLSDNLQFWQVEPTKDSSIPSCINIVNNLGIVLYSKTR